jgi:transporter family-2 protein
MPSLLLSAIVGVLGGIAIGFQNPLAAMLGRRLGILESVFIIHVGGALVAGAPLLLIGGGRLGAWRTVPPYAVAAGALGVVLIGAVAFTIPRIGVASAVALIVAAQLVIGAWLDHHGYLGTTVRPVDMHRLIGIVLLLVGAWLVLRRR